LLNLECILFEWGEMDEVGWHLQMQFLSILTVLAQEFESMAYSRKGLG
jgi:hypothetical protein